jgi:hypothetical protein
MIRVLPVGACTRVPRSIQDMSVPVINNPN